MKRLYKIVINDDDKSGMDAISLVEDAAVQRNFLKFAEQKKIELQAINKQKHIITGVVALADTPIYRYDEMNGEYWVIFDRQTIEKMVEKYAKYNLFNRVNLQHNNQTFQDGIYMVESYIVNKERGIVPQEFADVPDGSWIVSYKIENNELWDAIEKSGVLNGFSLQGLFELEQVFSAQNYNKIEKIGELMKLSKIALRNLILQFQDVMSDKGLLTIDGEIEIGNVVFIGEEPATNGEYLLQDMVLVVEDGKIAEIKPIEKPEEPMEEEPKEIEEEALEIKQEEQDEEPKEEEPKEDERDAKIAELEKMVAELEEENEKLKKELAEKDEMLQMSVEKFAETKPVEKMAEKKSIYSGLKR